MAMTRTMEDGSRAQRVTRPRGSLLPLLVVAAMLLTACGGAAETADDAGGTTTAASPGSATPADDGSVAEAGDDPLAALVDAAEGQGPVVWYESTPSDVIAPVVEAFEQRYPDVGLEHVRLEGGAGVAARIVQERQAQAPTADVGTSGPDTILELADRGLLADVDGDALGLDPQVLPQPQALVTAVSTYVVLYNTDEVAAADAPASWEDLVDERWAGALGTWAIASGPANLAAVWGEEQTRQWVTDLAALEPRLYPSTFPLAADVGSGEIPVALGIYHTAQPPIEAGAPIEVVLLDPTPVSTIYTGLVADSPNADAAQLFLAWLHSDEGAQAYEDATARGNPYLDTQTAELLADRQLTEWPLEETDRLEELIDAYGTILEEGGTAVEAG